MPFNILTSLCILLFSLKFMYILDGPFIDNSTLLLNKFNLYKYVSFDLSIVLFLKSVASLPPLKLIESSNISA